MSENKNCLVGIYCPRCKSLGPFTISAKVYCLVHDDGVSRYDGCDWDDESSCQCSSCCYQGPIKVFKKVTKRALTANISWTESLNCSATIKMDVPIDTVIAEAANGIHEDLQETWWNLLQKQMADNECTCQFVDEVEHRQLLSIDSLRDAEAKPFRLTRRRCEKCGGDGPARWDTVGSRYKCRGCHSRPDEAFRE